MGFFSKNHFWNKPIPYVGWQAEGNAVKGTVSGVGRGIGRGLKWGAISAVVAGGAVAGVMVLNSLRNGRRDSDNDIDDLPPPSELNDRSSQALDFQPQGPARQETLMGMQPVEGELALREKMRRNGMGAGADIA